MCSLVRDSEHVEHYEYVRYVRHVRATSHARHLSFAVLQRCCPEFHGLKFYFSFWVAVGR